MRVRQSAVLVLLAMSAFSISLMDVLAAELKVTELKQLAGTWKGKTQAGSDPTVEIEVGIDENGKTQSTLRPSGAGQPITTTGEFRLEGGKLTFESAIAKLGYSLHEKEGRRFLTGEGRRKSDGRKVWTELMEVK